MLRGDYTTVGSEGWFAMIGTGAFISAVIAALIRRERMPSICINTSFEVIEIRRGTSARQIPFPSISRIVVGQDPVPSLLNSLEQIVLGARGIKRIGVCVILDNGDTVQVGTVSSGDKPEKLRERADAIAQLIADATGAPKEWVDTYHKPRLRESRRLVPILVGVGTLTVVALVVCLVAFGRIFLRTNRAIEHSSRGVEYYEQGRVDLAIEEFTQAIALDPEYAPAYYNRGNAYVDKGDLDRAIADYDQTIELDPEYANAYYGRGIVYGEKGDLDRAIADYDQTIELDPEYAGAYNGRGIVYGEKGDFDQAIADFDQAIALDPEHTNAYYNRGLTYAMTGRYDQALADLSEAIELGVSDALVYYLRGCVYAEIGEREKAISDLERAWELGLDPTLQQDARALLEELRQ